MIEQFGFSYGTGTSLNFSTLKNEYGFILKEVKDSGSVSWDIATSKNPYQNGDNVENRTANAREISIYFQYTGKIPPDEADQNLYNYLALALNGQKLYLHKTKTAGNLKIIECVIQSINRLIYTDVPLLEIVLHAKPFWEGISDGRQLVKTQYGVGYYFLGELSPKGNIDPENAVFKFSVVSNDTERIRRCDLMYGEGTEPLRFGYTFPVIPSENLTKQVIEIDASAHYSIKVLSYNGNMLVDTEDITSNIVSGQFPQIKAGETKNLAFLLNNDAGAIINPNNYNTFYYDYIPLWIR